MVEFFMAEAPRQSAEAVAQFKEFYNSLTVNERYVIQELAFGTSIKHISIHLKMRKSSVVEMTKTLRRRFHETF